MHLFSGQGSTAYMTTDASRRDIDHATVMISLPPIDSRTLAWVIYLGWAGERGRHHVTHDRRRDLGSRQAAQLSRQALQLLNEVLGFESSLQVIVERSIAYQPCLTRCLQILVAFEEDVIAEKRRCRTGFLQHRGDSLRLVVFEISLPQCWKSHAARVLPAAFSTPTCITSHHNPDVMCLFASPFWVPA